MPIRINLLAEAQALEDMRRRDPVKRAIWTGVVLIILMLVWSSSLQLKALIAKGDLNRAEAQVATRTNEYRAVLEKKQKLAEVNHNLESLQKLASSRLLHGTILDALQHTAIDDVHLSRIRSDLSYILNEEVKPKTNANGGKVLGKPATVTERVLLTFEARDYGSIPGDQVNKYKQSVSSNSYFHAVLGRTNDLRLASLSPPQTAPEGKPFVQFTLECRYPEKTR